MGDGNFRLPTEFTPLDRSPKHLVQVSMSAAPTAVTNLVQIRARGASGQMGKIQRNFYLFIYLFIPFFHQLTYRSDPPTDFHAGWLKPNDTDSRKDVPLGV